jgi:hypothetical protein
MRRRVWAERMYLIMSFQARCYLIIPVSPAEVERLFSQCGLVITKRRNRLGHEKRELYMLAAYNVGKEWRAALAPGHPEPARRAMRHLYPDVDMDLSDSEDEDADVEWVADDNASSFIRHASAASAASAATICPLPAALRAPRPAPDPPRPASTASTLLEAAGAAPAA